MFIVTANAWMNVPVGFDIVGGIPRNIRPWEAMWNPMAAPQTIHMVIAAFAAIGFIVSGIHAKALLSEPTSSFHRKGFAIALIVGGIGAFIQPFSGDFCAKSVAHFQPVKLAALGRPVEHGARRGTSHWRHSKPAVGNYSLCGGDSLHA